MSSIAFRGYDELISLLDAAASQPSVEERVRRVERDLCLLIKSGAIELPESFRQPDGQRYARRLLHKSDDPKYTALIMVWGPGQGTPLHDHAGIWCVEGVMEGQIDVVQYELLEEKNGLCRFERRTLERAGVGATGCLIPPFEYHTILNADPESSSITIHVYGGEMTECNVFMPRDDGWHARETRPLAYTD
ncbi:MAG: cysteine dioxygenase family protein [Armatimonadetes bacterium]|nr:cysteine dioxygenase family protein [Armatimonadota bacterium]